MELERRFPEVRSFIYCSLCKNDLLDPRTLPCQHSFCFRCINAWGKKNFKYSTGCDCPVCGKVFQGVLLSDLKIDLKVLLLQKMAGVSGANEYSLGFTRFDENKDQKEEGVDNAPTRSTPNSEKQTNGMQPHANRQMQQQPTEESEEVLLEDTNGPGLESAGGFNLDDLLDSDEDGLNIGGAGDVEVSDLLSSDVDSSVEDEADGGMSEYLTSESSSDDEQDAKLIADAKLEVVQQVLFDDDDIDTELFRKIFLPKPKIVKTVDIRHKKELKEPFVHDISITRDGNVFVVDINNNVVKCCDPEGLILKKTPKKLTFKPIRLCELYTGEMLVVELNKFGRGKISAVKRSLESKDNANKDILRSLKKICVVRQMPEDRKRFYCGDSNGFVHRVNLKNPETYLKFHSILPRVYHMAAANSLIAVNDGNLQGNTSKIVRLFDEDGNLQWSYSGTRKHPFLYHGDMVFHGDYLLICDFWSAKLHIVFIPNEVPATIVDLKKDADLVFPSSITTTVDHKLMMAAQKANEKDKKCLIFTVEYLA